MPGIFLDYCSHWVSGLLHYYLDNINNKRRVRPTHQCPCCVGRTLRYSALYL